MDSINIQRSTSCLRCWTLVQKVGFELSKQMSMNDSHFQHAGINVHVINNITLTCHFSLSKLTNRCLRLCVEQHLCYMYQKIMVLMIFCSVDIFQSGSRWMEKHQRSLSLCHGETVPRVYRDLKLRNTTNIEHTPGFKFEIWNTNCTQMHANYNITFI